MTLLRLVHGYSAAKGEKSGDNRRKKNDNKRTQTSRKKTCCEVVLLCGQDEDLKKGFGSD